MIIFKQTLPSIWVQQETMADAINLVECVFSDSLCCTLTDELFASFWRIDIVHQKRCRHARTEIGPN